MENKLWVPVPDPLGILEKVTEKAPIQLRDPLRAFLGGLNPFSVNPWLPPEVREEFLKSYGEYPTRTAQAFAPVGNIEAARRIAEYLRGRVEAAMVR